jgi:nitrogen regulatory protein PII
MKEIEACLRPTLLDPALRGLEEAGARDITVIRTDAIEAPVDEDIHHFFQKNGGEYCGVAKLEIVCRDSEAGRISAITRKPACIGARGDGRGFISAVHEAFNIRTGRRGEATL